MLSFLIFPSSFSQHQRCIFPQCMVAQHPSILLLISVETVIVLGGLD